MLVPVMRFFLFGSINAMDPFTRHTRTHRKFEKATNPSKRRLLCCAVLCCAVLVLVLVHLGWWWSFRRASEHAWKIKLWDQHDDTK